MLHGDASHYWNTPGHTGNLMTDRMGEKMKVLALITARAGSKRVPQKNLAILAGKSLYQWTTELPLLDIVDTVAFSGNNLGVYRLPLKCIEINRPEELCQDNTPHQPVILHGLVEAEKRTHTVYDYLMLLQPTNPGRTIEDVERAIEICREKNCDHLYSYYIDDNLCGSYIAGSVARGPVAIKSGCVYMYRRNYIIDGFPADGIKIEAMKVAKSHGYNINTEEDFRIQEALWSLSQE